MEYDCYEVNKRNPFKEKMFKLKNNFEKKDLIGIGSSSKVKWNIIIINKLFHLIGLENTRKDNKKIICYERNIKS